MYDFLKEVYDKLLGEKELSPKNILDFIIENYECFEPNWHALGFIHCKLLDFGSGSLRLHFWSDKLKHADEQLEKIHDHLFSLKIYVISGKIKNEVFVVSEATSKKFTHYAYTVKYGEGYSYLIPSDNYFYDVSTSSEEITASGEYYGINSSSFHRSNLTNEGFALTLVATYEHLKKEPITLSTIENESYKYRKFLPYDKVEWRRILMECRDGLTENIRAD
ncbi:hypothetical protein [Pantoea agglomerans]|uniref:hypothetical protein n=1 Tax=Enterobacter agglomerans TaxID=549 RepID=UPI0011AFED34|nr:hypothetical protein [Pantoea agglomerans]UBN55510.1 hypothetical protein LB453_08160 [Pantoea agglomerans]